MINLACGISVSVVILRQCALLAAGRGGVLLSTGLGVASVQMAHYDNEGSRPLAQTSATGKVKWFNATKGYGFITLNDGGDAFCHASALQAVGHSQVPHGATLGC